MARKKTDAPAPATPPAPRKRTTKTAAKTSGNGAASSSPSSPSYEQIAEAAYLRYVNRGGGPGSDFDDWVEAERELTSRD